MSISNVTPIISQSEVNELTPKWNYNDPNHKPPFCTDYTEIDLNTDSNLNDEVMRITIGKDGCNFKKITENNNIAYIFHNKETNKIEIWGNKNKFCKVIKQINNHINYAKQLIEDRKKSTNL